MTVLNQLQEASFRGVTFFVPIEREAGGRKVAVHEYPNTSQRFVEDLGKLQPAFNVTAVVAGSTAVQQRARLTAALDQGQGVLVHPYLGRRNVISVNYTVKTSDRTVGEVVFDIEFLQTDEAFGLLGAISGIQGVFDAADRARSALDDAVTGRYSPLTIQDSIASVGERVREGLGVVQGTLTSVVNPVQDSLNEFTRQVGNVRSDVLSIVRTPQRITTAVRGVFDSFRSIAALPQDIRNEWAILTNFGSPIRFLSNGQLSITSGTVRSPIARTTRKRILEDDNLRILDQYIRVEALIGSFEAEAAAEFETDIDLLFARNRLADDFDRIIQNQDDVIASSNLGDEVLTDANVTIPSATVSEAEAFADGVAFDPILKAALEDLRVAAFSVLTDDVKSPFRVDTFDLGLVDIQIATHQLYGDQALVDSIAALNKGQNAALVRDPVKGLLG